MSYTLREAEALFRIDDYWVNRGQPYGKTREESDAKFKELLKVSYVREGERGQRAAVAAQE